MAAIIRKLFCRIAFVGCGLAPLCGSLGFTAWRHWSTLAMQRGDWLEARLGIEAEIEGLRPSCPGLMVADRVRFSDPESGQLWMLAEGISVRQGPRAVVVTMGSVHIPQPMTMNMWRLLSERLLRQESLLQKPIVIVVDHVAIRDTAGELELADWRMECLSEGGCRRADIAFRSDHSDLEVRGTRLSIVRDPRPEVPSTRIELNTPDADVEACLLAGPASWFSRLAPHARFRGLIFVDITSQGWQGEVTGQVGGIELRTLTEQRLPHSLTGDASVDIQQAVFHHSRLQRLSATVRSGPGKVGQGLLKSMQRLGMIVPETGGTERHEADEMLDYQQLAVMLDLSDQGVAMRGTCDPPRDGTVVMSRFGPLLKDPGRTDRKSSFDLIAALLDNGRADVLLTETGERLWRALPFCDARVAEEPR